MSDDVTIEVVSEQADVDWGELHRLLNDSFAYMEGRVDPSSSLTQMSAEDLKRKAQVETLFVARQLGNVVGSAYCREEGASIYIGKVAVAKELQGRGIGRRLIKRAEQLATERGCAALELETRVELVENQAAFGRLGFVEVSRSAHAGYAQPTSVRMRKPVGDW